jgi:predicted nucleotidyltransferase
MMWKLIAEHAPRKGVLFGSHAYGTPGPDSDIDLLIIKETPERFLNRWMTVQRILTGTHRALPVEIAIGDQFIAEILEKGEVLYAA